MAEKNVWGSLCGLGVARGPRGAGSKNRGQDDRRVLIRTIVPHRASKEPEWIPLEVVIVERRRRSSDDGVGVRRVVEVVVLDQPVRQVDDRASTGSTRLTLTHSRLARAEVRDEQERGWLSCIAKLDALYVA